MGAFSKIQRFHGAGEGANINNVERFGTPAFSLYTSTKVFTLHHHIDVTDENENIVYTARTQFPSIHDKTDLFKNNGERVAHIERKLISLHERHFISMRNGLNFELSNEIFHIVKDITNIEGLGWQLRGNLLALNFELYDRDGSIIAVIGQKFLSIHDKYCIDIYKREYVDAVVAILIALQHMIRDRESAAASGGSGGGSSSSG